MLTAEKLKIYTDFNGDIDGWARSAVSEENYVVMKDDDWFLINELIMGLKAIAGGVASEAFERDVERRVVESTADEETRVALRALATRGVD